jgi:putative peptidoglycan lipid II flippase
MSDSSNLHRSFERHVRTVTSLTMVSRFSGLARDASLSRVFGIGPVIDAFAFGFMVPNLFRRLFGEGALSASFLPVYLRLKQDDPDAARRAASLLVLLMLVVLNGLVIVAEIGLFAIWWSTPETGIAVTAPFATGHGLAVGFLPGYPRLGWELLMLMLPYMPLICIVAIAGSVLQANGRFGPNAAAPVLLNLVVVAATLGSAALVPGEGFDAQVVRVRIVAAGVIVAGVGQLVWSLAAMRRFGLEFRGLSRRDLPPVVEAMRVAIPMILGFGVLQLNTFVDGLLASWPTMVGPTILGMPYPLAEGSMAAITNAQRLYEFPLGVFGLAVATVIFPTLASLAGDAEGFRATLRKGVRLTLFIGIPASVGLMLVGTPAVATMLQGGRFTAADTERVAFILLGYAPAIWAYSASNVLVRAFYARGEPMVPVRVALGMVGLNFGLNVVLIFTPLREAGLAWSTAICAVLQFAILARLLARRTGPFLDGEVRSSVLRTVAVTATMVLAVVAAGRFLPDGEGWSERATRLAGLVAIGGLAVAAAASALRMPELRWSLGKR